MKITWVWFEIQEALGWGFWLSQTTPTPQLDGSLEDNLDLPHRGPNDSSADLSCDSRANSDYETDGEGYTDGEGGPHTDVDEEPPAPALVRSSEPVLVETPESLRGPGRASGAQVSGTGGWPRHGSGDGADTRKLSFLPWCKQTETSLTRSVSGTRSYAYGLLDPLQQTLSSLCTKLPRLGCRVDARSLDITGWLFNHTQPKPCSQLDI